MNIMNISQNNKKRKDDISTTEAEETIEIEEIENGKKKSLFK